MISCLNLNLKEGKEVCFGCLPLMDAMEHHGVILRDPDGPDAAIDQSCQLEPAVSTGS